MHLVSQWVNGVEWGLWSLLKLHACVLEPVKTIGVRNVHAITKSLTVMSWKRRDIKPLLQPNSGNNLIFVPWLQSIDTVYVDGSQESNAFLSSKERTTRQGSVCYMGSEFKYSYARNVLKRSKEVSGLCHKLMCSLCSDSKGAKCSCTLFWNPWNYWCSECTRNHQRVFTVMSWIRRGI